MSMWLTKKRPEMVIKRPFVIMIRFETVYTLMSILATDYIQKIRGQALLFSFEYNLSEIRYQRKSDYLEVR